MKKLLALMVVASLVIGCSSNKEPEDNLVVVKHGSSKNSHKHHKKHANVSSNKMGNN